MGEEGELASGWAGGMFGARARRARCGEGGGSGGDIAERRRRRSGGGRAGDGGGAARLRAAPRRRNHGTLTELRWHEALPDDGAEAEAVSRRVAARVMDALAPAPHLNVLQRYSHGGADDGLLGGDADRPPLGARTSFVDISTGLRLRALTWGGSRRDTVLLLHGLGSAADAWCHAAQAIVSDMRDTRCVAVDLRGHGRSARSAGGEYSIDALADDVMALIVELDLYSRPLYVWGHDLGAAAALSLAARAPQLVASVVLSELSLNWPADHPLYFPGQGVTFDRLADPVRFLAAHSQWGHGPRSELDAVAFCAAACDTASGGGVRFRIDPRWRCAGASADAHRRARELRVPALVLRGEHSHRVTGPAARALHAALGAGADDGGVVAAADTMHALETVPGGDHWECYHPEGDSVDFVVAFFERHAGRTRVGAKEDRLPEVLGLRPLPQYATLEEAKRALLPRRIPTKEGILAELNALELENGEELTSGFDSAVTGLAKEDPEVGAPARARARALPHAPSDTDPTPLHPSPRGLPARLARARARARAVLRVHWLSARNRASVQATPANRFI